MFHWPKGSFKYNFSEDYKGLVRIAKATGTQITKGPTLLYYLNHGSLALDGAVVRKISKRHFFQDIENSFHGVTQIGLKPHQNFFQKFFSTNMVARGVQSFFILEGTSDLFIKQ